MGLALAPPGPLGGREGNSPHPSGQNTAISRKVSIATSDRSNMCSSPLLHPRLPPSKAPLPIGRSWVQFLVMTEWKNPIFSEDFIFSDLKTRCNKVYSGPCRPPPTSPLLPSGRNGNPPPISWIILQYNKNNKPLSRLFSLTGGAYNWRPRDLGHAPVALDFYVLQNLFREL